MLSFLKILNLILIRRSALDDGGGKKFSGGKKKRTLSKVLFAFWQTRS